MVSSLQGLHIPFNFQTNIHWFQTSVDTNFALSTSAITEQNQSFQLVNTAIAASIAGLYDQYAIFAVYIRVSSTGLPASSGSGRIITALDYDNVANLGSIATLLGYSTSTDTSSIEVQERYVEPCNAPALYNGSAFSAFGQDRMWVDCANTGVPHYGLRCIADIVSNSGAVLNFKFTYIICARNII
jgi:hypothetical protein